MNGWFRRRTADTAVLFLTHSWSEAQLAQFLRLHRAAGRGFDVHLLLDAANPAVEAQWRRELAARGLAGGMAPFRKDEVLRRLSYGAYPPGTDIFESMHFPVIDFWNAHPDYSHYWLIEFDVHVASWGWFLRSFRRSRADLLASHLAGYGEVPDWYHWPGLVAPAGRALAWGGGEGAQPMRAFCPIFRISARGLACLHAGHRAGWQGHLEAVVPTTLRDAGLVLEDFNRHGRFYKPGPVGPDDGKPPYSSLRWRPPIDPTWIKPSRRRRIYHPVKI